MNTLKVKLVELIWRRKYRIENLGDLGSSWFCYWPIVHPQMILFGISVLIFKINSLTKWFLRVIEIKVYSGVLVGRSGIFWVKRHGFYFRIDHLIHLWRRISDHFAFPRFFLICKMEIRISTYFTEFLW